MRTTEKAAFKATHCAATGKTLFAYQWECVCVCVCMPVGVCVVGSLIEMYLLVVELTVEVESQAPAL